MTTFAATFSNGQTISRNTDNAYAFAWAILRGDKIIDSGFSADRANAAKAAEAKMPKSISERDRKHPASRRYHAKMAKDAGLGTTAEWLKSIDEEVAARRAALRIEIVEAA